jgi:hypothetical protein
MPFTVPASAWQGGQLLAGGLTNLGQDIQKTFEKIDEGQKQDASSTLLMQQALQTGAITHDQFDDFLAAPRNKRIGMAATVAGDYINKQRKAQADIAEMNARAQLLGAQAADYAAGPQLVDFPIGVKRATAPTEEEIAAGAQGPMQSSMADYQAALGAAPPQTAQFVRYRGALHQLTDSAGGQLTPYKLPGTNVVIGVTDTKGNFHGLNEPAIQSQLPGGGQEQMRVEEIKANGQATGKVAALFGKTMHVLDKVPTHPGILYDAENDVYLDAHGKPVDPVTDAHIREAKAKREAAAEGTTPAATPPAKAGGFKQLLIDLGLGTAPAGAAPSATPAPSPTATTPPEMPESMKSEKPAVALSAQTAQGFIDQAKLQLGADASPAAIAKLARKLARNSGYEWPEKE